MEICVPSAPTVKKFMAEPNNAMMVEPAQEPVGRDVHHFPGRIIIPGLGEVVVVFGTETPSACEIHVQP
jgi:hypothetical protein